MKLSKRQKSILNKAFNMIGRGLADCDALVAKATESEEAFELLALRVEQVTKLMTDINTGISQSRAADTLLAQISKKQRANNPKLRLVKGGA